MLGVLGIAYMAAGYYCFWQVLKQVKPGRGGALTTPIIGLFLGPLLFAYAIIRTIVDPSYQPVQAKFIEFDKTGESYGRRYETVWQSRRDLGQAP